MRWGKPIGVGHQRSGRKSVRREARGKKGEEKKNEEGTLFSVGGGLGERASTSGRKGDKVQGKESQKGEEKEKGKTKKGVRRELSKHKPNFEVGSGKLSVMIAKRGESKRKKLMRAERKRAGTTMAKR